MKIGILTGLWYIAEGATLLESLQHVAALGFHYVDLHGVFHAGPAHLSHEERHLIKRELKSLGLTPRNYVCHAPHNIPTADESELELDFKYLAEAVEMASQWEMNQVMLNAGISSSRLGREKSWQKSVRFLQRVCDYAEPRGVFIAQEAEPFIWFLVNNTTSTLKMIEDVNRANFATLVDLGHMALARETPDDLRKLTDTIIHGHFSDHEPLRHTNQTVGTGFVDFDVYLDALARSKIDRRVQRFGYDDLVISLELGLPGDAIDNPDDMAKRSLEFIQHPTISLSAE